MDRQYQLFSQLLASFVIRNKIFQSVSDINDRIISNSKKHNVLRGNWYDISCFPHLLIKFNYIERYKQIFNTIIRDSNNNDSNNETISKYKILYIESLKTAAKLENLDVIEFLHQSLSNEIDYNSILEAKVVGSKIKVIEFLHKNVDHWFVSKGKALMDNARDLTLEVVRFLHENRSEGCSSEAIDEAARWNKLDILKFLHYNRTEGCTHNAKYFAALNANMDILMFLYENRTEDCPPNTASMTTCTGKASVTLLKYLLDNDPNQKLSENDIDGAARSGNVDVVRYLHENTTVRCTTDAMNNGAIDGHYEIVKFLNENRSEGCTSEAMDFAAYGYLDVVKYLHENRTEGCSEQAMLSASTRGHLEILKFLQENRTEGCSQSILDDTMRYGQFETFRYLLEKRPYLTYSPSAMDNAARCKDTTALQWFKDNTTLRVTIDAYRHAIDQANLPIVKWIHENTSQAIPASALEEAINCKKRDLAIIKYLLDNGAVATSDTMDNACRFDIISFLHYNRTEGCTSRAMNYAINRDDIQVIKFLEQNRTEHLNLDFSVWKERKAYGYTSRLKLLKQFNI
ncbi:hypothetical protein PPL_10850 [Heterostelium album PN500]|uniref:Ankyrin repeat protein n=1 Tax=Heterostelium pallidum (strain ATCC 26659 / Pp 5 / PN500) TaxID=670386 RepID=D3BS58_HETP5|nr:hypothetical protein PPL_10850 [Heterostelium album PN500]EFA75795.1 hypothetical protein PPL_10850 [Heterostelium album PN500]|eukprot:XP_020427929.1 hypothetical protein PPL_10850 [Heterostelium album PN500]